MTKEAQRRLAEVLRDGERANPISNGRGGLAEVDLVWKMFSR